ncbi:MAG TPA: signal peptidase I [Thermoanaerobaculia bacterium]|nr:signal peptidase I [Thermoanaerobaculia bacterium]
MKRVLALVATVVLVVAWWVLVPRYGLRSFRIPTVSMAPALPMGCYVLVHPTKDVHVGEIAVFRHDPKTMLAKRLVAGPGDTVEIRDKKLIVNGREVSEPYVTYEDPMVYPKQPALPEPYASRDQFGPYRVPADAYFTLGDNRDRSSDSRYWGAVSRNDVLGRVVYVVTANGGMHRPR